MFMKMSGAPCWFANSRSWCTGMKSRDAIAPATMRVGVTSITNAGSVSPTCSASQSTVVRASFIGIDRAEQWEHEAVVERFEAHLHGHTDRHCFGCDADDVRNEPGALGQIDERDDVRLRKPRQRRVVRDHEAEHAA